MGKKKKWIRLRRVINFLKHIKIEPSRGDGGFLSDTTATVIGNRFQNDTTFIVNDSLVVARPKN